MLKKIFIVLGALTVLGTIIGGFIYYEDRINIKFSKYAPLKIVTALAQQSRLTSIRLDQKIIHDKIDRARSQMRQIEISCKTNNPLLMKINAQRNYHELQQDLVMFNRELKQININESK